MTLNRSFLALILNISFVFISSLSLTNQQIFAQDSRISIQRGYRTGYSDGYMAGYRDVIDNNTKNFQKHSEYTKADRAYNKDYGSLEDYRDGYQQGFENGYNTGFEKRSFDATIPADLNKRGIAENNTAEATIKENIPVTTVAPDTPTNTVEETPITQTQDTTNTSVATSTDTPSETAPVIRTSPERLNSAPSGEDIITIPVDTELIVELVDDINTERNREGDKFTARVFSPNEINGAIIEGRISKIQRPGRIKRRAEISLSFDRIILPENRWSNFNAIVTEVLPTRGDNVKRVDTEGTVEGKRTTKSDSIKVGATTGTGLVIGAIAGGPVGAAVGAGVGAAFGVGAVVVERGKHIRLNNNQQLRIKTAYETQIK
jgi:type IV secretion system protein VirB10